MDVCTERSRRTHGHTSHTRTRKEKSIYTTWCHMISRCFNPANKDFKHYGGRLSGPIQVCAQWTKYEAFWRDMETTWFPGATIDRSHNDEHYNCFNCRWEPRKNQSRNRRREYNRGEKQWCHKLTWKSAAWIRVCFEQLGWSRGLLAECNGVSRSTIDKVIKGKTWRVHRNAG